MNRIKEARIAAGLSQKYVATTLGIAGPSVSNWESGKTNPTPDNYVALASLLGVSVDFLLGNDSANTEPSAEEEQPVSDRMRRFREATADLDEAEMKIVELFVQQVKNSRK